MNLSVETFRECKTCLGAKKGLFFDFSMAQFFQNGCLK